MVRITKVHTGGGDAGETSLACGERVSKCDARVDFFGTIDEVNAIIGMVQAESSSDSLSKISEDFKRIQRISGKLKGFQMQSLLYME